jgi:hypothetical protein
MNSMTVKEIEQAIEKLPREEVVTLSAWFEEFETRIWDSQIADDLKAGRFDGLIQKAKADHELGLSKPL